MILTMLIDQNMSCRGFFVCYIQSWFCC